MGRNRRGQLGRSWYIFISWWRSVMGLRYPYQPEQSLQAGYNYNIFQ